MNHIRDVFECEPEELSEDADLAHLQYNGRAPLSNSSKEKDGAVSKTVYASDDFRRPLVATDPLLDELGVGLMDCPDIQSGIFAYQGSQQVNDEANEHALHRRFEQVADARAKYLFNSLRIASGLLLVVQSNMIGDQTLEQLGSSVTQLLPHIRTFIAVNRVPKRYSPEEIAKEVIQQFGRVRFTEAFLAYDFRGPDETRKLPPPPSQWQSIEDHPSERLPVFFSISEESLPSIPEQFSYLVDLRAKLNFDQLARDLSKSAVERTVRQLNECLRVIDASLKQQRNQTHRLYRTFSEALLQFTAKHDDGHVAVRLQLSQEIIDQMKASLERTAPWWAKPTQVIGRWSANASASAKEFTKRIPLLPSLGQRMSETVEWVRGRIRRGEHGSVMTAEQLASSFRNADRSGDLPPSSNSLEADKVVQAAQRIIERFQQESHARLNDEALDRCTSVLWNQMSWKQKLMTGVAPATLIFAPLLAVITIPIDFGTSHVLVFATVKELLLAGVASAGLFLMQSDQFPEIAEGQAAWKQIATCLRSHVMSLVEPDHKRKICRGYN